MLTYISPTLTPTPLRRVRVAGLKNPDILLTDTVGFIQKLPTNLVAAFRATLEEITEADILLVKPSMLMMMMMILCL